MTKSKSTNKLLALLLAAAMLAALVPVIARASYTPEVIGGVNVGFGDPNRDATDPECYMSLAQVGSTTVYNAVFTNSNVSGFYPDRLALYAAPRDEFSGTLTLESLSDGIYFATYDEYAEETDHAVITHATNQDSDVYTVKIEGAGDVAVKNGAGDDAETLFTIHFYAPQNYIASGVTPTPGGYVGYLPVGQYATGKVWGSPYSDGFVTTGHTPKIVGGYSSTGLSLGAAGGYAEYNMVINNFDADGHKVSRPYGVDFIVYGNAFVGNPEAGSVKVYGREKGKSDSAWYELAGSLYYSDNTLRDVDVTYKKVENTDDIFTTKGIWYQITKGDTVIKEWTRFNQKTSNGSFVDASVAWWPEVSEGYLGTNGAYGGVDDVVISDAKDTITYKHVTLVKDTDTTSDYGFGYFDVTPNGTSYGTPVNPYVYGTTGGNAYDLDWAVNKDGNPVELHSISKIRVYTSAAMKTGEANTFTVPAIFGETSAEVCGIYAVEATTGTVNQTSAPTINLDNTPLSIYIRQNTISETIVNGIHIYDATHLTQSITSVTASASSGTTANIWINDSNTGTYTRPNSVKIVRIVAQNGNDAPYIAIVKFA